VNILGNVQDNSGITSLNYSLNGTTQNLSIGPDGMRLQSSGDFNIEIDRAILRCGSNQVIIQAKDYAGNVKKETVTIEYSCNKVWPRTYSVIWNNVARIQDASQIVDGKWIKEMNGIRPVEIGYDRLIAIGDVPGMIMRSLCHHHHDRFGLFYAIWSAFRYNNEMEGALQLG